jgi:hypothetical protein
VKLVQDQKIGAARPILLDDFLALTQLVEIQVLDATEGLSS